MSDDSKRAFLAVILSGIILFGWQYFFAPTPVAVNNQTNTNSPLPSGVTADKVNKPVETSSSDRAVVAESKVYNINQFSIDESLKLREIKSLNSDKEIQEIFKNFSTSILFKFDGESSFKPVAFALEQQGEGKYLLKSQKINGEIVIDKSGFLNFSLASSKNFRIKFLISSESQELGLTQVSSFAILKESLDLIDIGDEEEATADVRWFGVDFNYHFFGYIFDKTKNLAYRSTESKQLEVMNLKSSNSFDFRTAFVQKSYDDLLGFGDKLELTVDFGIWSILALPILRGLQFFYEVFPNYGIAIILLTIIIRFLTFPLQYKSFKSMKKMQVIQPELTKLREKYADDPQKMQQETMALFKKAGANPLGGCLPLLLQMPIFFAFYQVLYSSVELVDAPFYFWIVDLSIKDPYYVLPVLMALSMFFNQKITPMTTTDPMQQKLMMFMPLVFGLFMKDLPAGLSLYILISTLVGMLQQIFVFKKTT